MLCGALVPWAPVPFLWCELPEVDFAFVSPNLELDTYPSGGSAQASFDPPGVLTLGELQLSDITAYLANEPFKERLLFLGLS